MLTAIQFHNKKLIRAVKIQNIGAQRLLSSKLQAFQFSISELVPQKFFCPREIMTHGSGEVFVFGLHMGSYILVKHPHPHPLP